ncbi:DNA repair exonuclease [Sporosarcina sp. HYO08]|uniref:metallophosphoesterase family protein n=1 Tax=Sporosarcina sp. HYO08 TaxID=1759557 RepID=UPI00079227F6|nr:DNA repair exonuclease [Sporosarcina sp. HYO08]KXH79300.1 hypothetical protein AU377_12015 [Sporosarcina sp. HYO08]
MSTIRFIHTADLHLDSPFKGVTELPARRLHALKESTFKAFQNVVNYAVQTKPDFVLIVGDIYDGEDRSLRAQLKFFEGMKQLHEAGIPVILSYGNHDHLDGKWTRFELPENVHTFGPEVETYTFDVNGKQVSIHGFSYGKRHIREAMIAHYPVAEMNEVIHIGMLHGSIAGDESHAVYAPFTKSELLSKHYDYWALGHIHLRQSLHESPPIIYPGNIQGRHRKEQGMKGFYEVELSKTNATRQFVPASSLVFDRLDVSCEGIRHVNEWLAACELAVETFQRQTGAGIVELRMIDVDEEAMQLFSQHTKDVWLETIRDYIESAEPFVWIEQLSFFEQHPSQTTLSPLAKSVLQVMEDWNSDDWNDVLHDVYQHIHGVKYLPNLQEEDLEAVQMQAKSLFIKELAEMDRR